MPYVRVRLVLALLPIVFSTAIALAAEKKADDPEPGVDSFINLREELRKLDAAEKDTQREIDALEREHTRRSADEDQAQAAQQELEVALKTIPRNEVAVASAQTQNDHAAALIQEGPNATQIEGQLTAARQKLEKTRESIAEKERTMNRLLNIELVNNKFRSQLALGFAIVLLAVLIGLVLLLLKHRAATFTISSATRILMMFLLVLVVALVAITGLMQSKDLSTLLAALAGFVLGGKIGIGGDKDESETAPKENGKEHQKQEKNRQ